MQKSNVVTWLLGMTPKKKRYGCSTSKEHLGWQQTRKLFAYRESTDTILSVTGIYDIFVYSVQCQEMDRPTGARTTHEQNIIGKHGKKVVRLGHLTSWLMLPTKLKVHDGRRDLMEGRQSRGKILNAKWYRILAKEGSSRNVWRHDCWKWTVKIGYACKE